MNFKTKNFKAVYIFIILISSLVLSVNCYSAKVNNNTDNQISSRIDNPPIFQPLPQDFDFNGIRCIYKDYKGYMWFGTDDGLVRYDGINLTVYENDLGSETSISHNIINNIVEDGNNNLWIGTNDGLNLYNREKDNFIRTRNLPGAISTLNSAYISALFCDHDDNLWIGTYGGIYIYNKALNTLKNFREDLSDPKAISLNLVTSIASDKENNIWIGTQNGLNLFISEREGFKHFYSDKGNQQSLSSNIISTIEVDSIGNIWIGTRGGGINKLAKKGKEFSFKRYPLSTGLSNNYIISMVSDRNGYLWIGTDNGGLVRLNISTGRMDTYQMQTGNPYSIRSNSIWSIYVDNEERVWIGTSNKGIDVIDNKLRKFDSYQKNIFDDNGLPDNDVTGFAEDEKGNIWIATDGGGLCRFDPDSRKIIVPKSCRLTNKAVQCIGYDLNNNFWVGSWGGGIDKLNSDGSLIRNYKLDSKHGFGDNNVIAIICDSSGNIWAGTAGSGLFKFDTSKDLFVQVLSVNNSTVLTNSAYVTSLFKDSEGTVWIGTLNGLFKVIKQLNYSLDGVDIFHIADSAGLSSNMIDVIYEDREHRIWFGTTDKGLNLYNKENGSITVFVKKDGLPSNSIRGISEDDEGMLWITTNKGLSRFDFSTKVFTNYSKEDGLNSNEFFVRTILKSSKGEFFAGSESGFNVFNPAKIKSNTVKPPIYLTGFKINNKSVVIGEKNSPLQNQISETREIILNYKQSSFSIEFVAMSYTAANRNQYCYKLEGFDDDWNCIGNRRTAIYTNIKPGKYIFLVKGSNNDEVWNEIPARLSIIIKPPFWETWWALLIYFILILLITTGILNFWNERIRIKNQLKVEQMAREKEHELNESNIQFFTNISHEFRTPLSLIISPLENIIPSTQSIIRDRLKVIYRNAQKLLQLTNKLMDFRKLEGGIIKLKVEYGEILGFINEVTTYFIDDLKRRNINFEVKSNQTSISAWFDPDKIETIMLNLLSNALKNIQDNSEILISINVLKSHEINNQQGIDLTNLEPDNSFLQIEVIDHGVGILSEELPHIFEKFYRTKTSEVRRNSGTGIGLALVKGLVEAHHGNIYVRSIPGEETCFTVIIPIFQSAYHDDELIKWPETYLKEESKLGNANEFNESVADDVVQEDINSKKPEILIVEDDDELRKYLTDELIAKYVVKEAKNGEDGINIAFNETPDLIISDIIMPGQSGIDLCKAVKTDVRTSHIPVILLTARTTLDEQIEGIETGADVYITKPFNIQFLLAQIKQLIRTRRELYAHYSQDVYLIPNKMVGQEIDQEFLQKIIDYILLNIADNNMNVEGLAGYLGLSRSNVYRKIKALTGNTIIEFIRIIRLKEAIKLMQSKKYTLAEIAYQTGFTSPAYFTKSFKDQFGKPPSEYLKG